MVVFQSRCPSVVAWAPLTPSAFKHLPQIIFLLKILWIFYFQLCPRTSERTLLSSGSLCFWVLEIYGDHCLDWWSPKSSLSSKSFTLVLRVHFFFRTLSSLHVFQWQVLFSYEKMNGWRRDGWEAPPPWRLRNLHAQTLLVVCLQLQFSTWIWLGTTGKCVVYSRISLYSELWKSLCPRALYQWEKAMQDPRSSVSALPGV